MNHTMMTPLVRPMDIFGQQAQAETRITVFWTAWYRPTKRHPWQPVATGLPTVADAWQALLAGCRGWGADCPS